MTCAVRQWMGDSVVDHLAVLAYRISGYALMNLGDDVALLALMFC